jgi:hypothetical protein
MGLPRHLPPGDSGSGHGPFGEKAFKAALIGCVVVVLVGSLMLLLGGGAVKSVGTSLTVLGGLGLLTSAAGLLTERLLGRRPPPPPAVRARNGRGHYEGPPESYRRPRGRS